MLPLWIPIVGTLVAAFYASIRQGPAVQRRTIEVCTREISSRWVRENGVLKVYSETSQTNCSHIVVECSAPPLGLPTEIDGHPIRIRLAPNV